MCGHRVGKQGRMTWAIRIDIYTLACIKYIASGNPQGSTESSALW